MNIYQQQRRNMVQCQLETNGVKDPRILAAYENLPREQFVDVQNRSIAYLDEDLRLENGRYLMSPMTHARLVEAAAPKEKDVTLDLGCPVGYSPAIWSPLVSTVIMMRQRADYIDNAETIWKDQELCNIAVFIGPYEQGCAEHAPYSVIFLNGAVSAPPEFLFNQLAPNGRLLTVLVPPGRTMGKAVKYEKNEDGHVSSWDLFDAAAAWLPGFEPAPAFAL